MVIHRVLKDGTVLHEELTRSSWQEHVAADDHERMWGHVEGDCTDPVALFWSNLRQEGWECTPKQHAYADIVDPGWVGAREQVPAKTAVEPSEWPPEIALTPWMLSHMTTICIDDAKKILAPPAKEWPKQEYKPMVDKRGQMLLF